MARGCPPLLPWVNPWTSQVPLVPEVPVVVMPIRQPVAWEWFLLVPAQEMAHTARDLLVVKVPDGDPQLIPVR